MVRIPRAARTLAGALALLVPSTLLLEGHPADAASTTLVVNEIQTGSSLSAADEFVEIANVSAQPIDLTGYKLVYRSAASDSDTVLVRFILGPYVPGGGVLVYGGAEFTGPRDGTFFGSLAATGGGVALRDPAGKIVDSVAYGVVENAFIETRATVAPAKDHSIHRIPCGHDSDYNARDLQELLIPTPRMTCAGVRAPSVGTAAFTPAGVEPGGDATLASTIVPGTHPTSAVTADLTPLGGSAAAPLAPGFGDDWTLEVRVAAGTPPGPVSIRVRVADTAGGTGYGAASLYVKNPTPAPVVIHEVQTAGVTADEEFVELYNRTGAEVDLTGCRLVYRGPTSDEDTALFTFTGVRLKPHGYYLLGTAAFIGPKDATIKAGLSGTGGGLALRSPAGNLMDSAGYGSAANLFVETSPAPAPDAGESIERVPTGTDTNDNQADFRVSATPTPTPAVNKPVVTSVTFLPAAVPPGANTTITVIVAPGDVAVTDAAADLIVVGGDTNHPLVKMASGNAWSATFTVAPLTTMGHKTIAVYAKDGLGLVATGAGTLTVTSSVPNPPVKVNEVQTGGPASGADEFVELYNAGDAPAEMAGWSVVYRSEKGTADTVLHRFMGQTIAPRGYLLLAGEGFLGERNGILGSQMAPASGSVGLRDPLGALVDSVGYGTAENALVETSPAPAPEPGASIERRTPGRDTGSNSADFQVQTTPTPRAGGGIVLRPGDVNRDGLVNLADAVLSLRLAGGLSDGHTLFGPNADVWPATPDARATLEDALKTLRAATGLQPL